jgi:hypothetical protein
MIYRSSEISPQRYIVERDKNLYDLKLKKGAPVGWLARINNEKETPTL